MAIALGRTVWRQREANAEARRQRWVDSRQAMARYLASKAWYDKRDRAFLVWRCLGWAITAGPLAAFWFFPQRLHGEARILLAWPVQDFAGLGFLYAATIRGLALSQHRRLHRVGHHLGYQHVDTSVEANGIDNPEWPGCRERWYEILPVTQSVNRTESLLRRDRPSAPRKRRWIVRKTIAWKLVPRKWLAWIKPSRSHYWPYLRRTLIAVAVVRFWWVGVGFSAAVWAWGWAATWTWMVQAGRTI